MGVAAEGRFASLYDLFFDGLLKPIRLKNRDIIQKYGCKKIIDLGCGTGSQCQVLSKDDLDVVGMDLSEKMLAVAKKKDLQKTRLLYGDISKNGLPDGSFDCAIITLVLHPNDQTTIQQIIRDAKRVIQKDGVIIITDYDVGRQFKGKAAEIVIRIIESMANTSHRRNYFKFMERGGLYTILSEVDVKILESHSFYGNSLSVCAVQ
jgi:ubiquinone/menaquinone biosynthesis C-methylase UbiE